MENPIIPVMWIQYNARTHYPPATHHRQRPHAKLAKLGSAKVAGDAGGDAAGDGACSRLYMNMSAV